MNRNEAIAEALRTVRARIAEATLVAGRSPDQVRLVAVSKKMPIDDIRAAVAEGQRDFGENYAQELRDKRAELAASAPARASAPVGVEARGSAQDEGETGAADNAARDHEVRWHFLGPLQRNKVKYLAGQVSLIQSLDDADTLAEIERRAAATAPPTVRQSCLIQVNIAEENRKGGVPAHRLSTLLDRFASLEHVTCTGLMLIPPFSDDAIATRRHFAGLRELAEREARVTRPNVTLTELSMGMSHDFTHAVAEGATIVRVGTAIFGERPPR